MIRKFEPAEPEWMDVAETASPELERDLANLESLNRVYGGHRTVLERIDPLLREGRPLRIVDLGTGGGDVPRAVATRARELMCPVIITAVDRQGPTLEIAEKHSAEFPEIRFVRSDVLDFDPGKPFDLVLCNLLLHHLGESDAVRLLRRCRELAGRAAFVTDLRRSRLASAAIFAVTQVVYRDPMTRHDARLSAARAFSFSEVRKLAVSAGWWGFRHTRCPFFRQALWMDADQRGR